MCEFKYAQISHLKGHKVMCEFKYAQLSKLAQGSKGYV